MVSKTRKKGKGKSFKKILFILFLGGLVVFLIYSNVNMALKRMDLAKELDDLNESQEDLLKEREALKFGLGESYSSTFLEKVAREDMNFKKPGEKVYVIKKQGDGVEENSNLSNSKNFIEIIQEFLRGFNK